ncbi:hypothetical protein [Streptomyces sp. NPDC050264]|uniref:hypothetical protein n=1 Tax=Streptomyces sp. NPDC050264 TaxID=3155038 RepID=UPI00342258AE
MELITETYFGWTPYPHTDTCPHPVWDAVEVRHDEGAHPIATGAEPHACPNDMCDHGPTFPRVRVRLLCRDCSTVHLLVGEGLTQATTTVAATGWGQAPSRWGSVWLWPGRPVVKGGEPSQYLVTREPNELTTATLCGIITGYRDATGARRWIAGVQPDSDGAHQIDTLRWRHASRGLDSLEVAAEWLATTDKHGRRLEVAV